MRVELAAVADLERECELQRKVVLARRRVPRELDGPLEEVERDGAAEVLRAQEGGVEEAQLVLEHVEHRRRCACIAREGNGRCGKAQRPSAHPCWRLTVEAVQHDDDLDLAPVQPRFFKRWQVRGERIKRAGQLPAFLVEAGDAHEEPDLAPPAVAEWKGRRQRRLPARIRQCTHSLRGRRTAERSTGLMFTRGV